MVSIDESRAIDFLLRVLRVEGITGQEKAVSEEIIRILKEVGVPATQIRFDKVHEKIPLPTQTGNLIVMLPGTMDAPRRLFACHMDTVPLGAGAVPLRKGNRIVPEGKTALGGDDRTGVGCLLTLAAALMEKKFPYPPITLLFTVREESGLWGARFVEGKDLGNPLMGFNIDGRSAREITVGAIGAERWEVEIFGKAAHAGVHPEQGISATAVASLALAQIHQQGWFGKVKKGSKEGTSNVGVFGGINGKSAGDATNVVTDYVRIHGESRSHDVRFASEITQSYKKSFLEAKDQVLDDRGKKAKVKFTARRDYFPFQIKENSPVVKTAQKASLQMGWEPELRITNGGLDANWFVRQGVPTITFGAGQNKIHTVEEFVELKDYLEGCQLALTLAGLV